jgi:hypothetical protein
MMGQRKLNPEELERVEQARHNLRGMCGWTTTDRGDDYWRGVDKELSKMLLHGTTDGRPYIEPQPEIGDGYRLATEADAWRKDVQYFSNLRGKGWFPRAVHGKPLESSYHYRVPIDRIPTDEDARQRPTVMVRDCETSEWKARSLLAVTGRRFPFVAGGSGYDVAPWRLCRFPYPGELD